MIGQGKKLHGTHSSSSRSPLTGRRMRLNSKEIMARRSKPTERRPGGSCDVPENDLWGMTSTARLPIADDLDKEMWGSEGVPVPLPVDEDTGGGEGVPSDYSGTPRWLTDEGGTSSRSLEGSDDNGDADAPWRPNRTRTSTTDLENMFGDVVLSDVVWKRRTGFGKLSVRKHGWERRRLVLAGTKVLYYSVIAEERDSLYYSVVVTEEEGTTSTLEEKDKGGVASTLAEEGATVAEPSPSADGAAEAAVEASTSAPQKSESNVSDSSKRSAASWFSVRTETVDPASPRGVLDLVKDNVSVEAAEENSSSSSFPTPHVLVLKVDNEVKWKFCFDSSEQQLRWLSALRDIVGEENASDKTVHSFEPGDHVIRWEVLVIGYPIQIHGIVLEAGKNCVIIADFGLTGYWKKDKGEGDMAADVHSDSQHNDPIMEAWKTLRPREMQRINVLALTDEGEIRKWKKVNYRSNNVGKRGHNILGALNWFGKSQKSSSDDDETTEEEDVSLAVRVGYESMPPGSPKCESDGRKQVPKNDCSGSNGRTENGDAADKEENPTGFIDPLNDPNWFNEDGATTDTSTPSSSTLPLERPAVFSLEEMGATLVQPSPPGTPQATPQKRAETSQSQQQQPKLPKTDPAKIVLARTNFLLEHGEEVLPPYHIFHSNSECIAVWCKTGRWSTLQTSVFLHSTAVGNAKSATVVSMGVAAAHVFLLPVVAMGGIAAVSAPWLILKHSKGKWEAATRDLTDKFWSRAEPEVFVEAIEHWSFLS